MDSNGNLKLVFVRFIKKNVEELYEYELLFSTHPNDVWGQFWDDNSPSQCGDITPEKTTYDKVYKIASQYELTTIQELSCYSMEHAINQIVALSWINLNVLDEYPSEGRMTLTFGEDLSIVEKILNTFDIEMEELN